MRIRKNAKVKERKILHQEWLWKHIPVMAVKEYISKPSSQEIQMPEVDIDLNSGHS